MGIRDDIRRLGVSAIGAIGETAANWAGASMAKADGSTSTMGADDEDTTASNPVPTEKATEDPKFLSWDPYSIVEQLGYKDRPSSISYGTLRSIPYKMPVIQAIINTRVNQVASFSTPQRDRYGMGYKIKLRDSERAPTRQDKQWMKLAESLIMRTGVTDNPRGRDNFETFLRKITLDSLLYDQLCVEIVHNRKGQPAEWYAVDAATMRIADSSSTSLDEDAKNAIRYVQIYDGMIIAEYTQEEMYFGIRNPSTDIRLQGYGVSEIEMMITTITNLLYSFSWNQNAFTQGTASKGILNFKGTAMSEKMMQSFKRQWYTQIASVKNAWKTPITNAEGLEYINMQTSARDMEFSAWMDFQIKLCCFVPETLVAMDGGFYKRIDEVKPGESVITHMGRTRGINNVQISAYDGDLVCLKAGGEIIKSTPEHPFLTVSSRINSWMKRDFENPNWVASGDLVSMEDYLVVPKTHLPLSSTKINLRDYLKTDEYKDCGDGKITGNSSKANPLFAEIELTEENAFAIGLYVAEGCSCGSLNTWSFHEEEHEYHKNASDFVKSLGINASISAVKDRHSVQVRGASAVLGRALRRMCGHKAPNKFIPKEIMNASEKTKWAFISGLIAGDGSVPKHKSGRVDVQLSTVSETLANQLKVLLLSLGVWSYTYRFNRAGKGMIDGRSVNNGQLITVRMMGSHLFNVEKYLTGPKGDDLRRYMSEARTPAGAEPTLKSDVYETEAYFYIPITEIWSEPYKGEVYNLEVERDHTYLVNGGVSVHNCALYLMDPVELNFSYGNVGQKSALGGDHNKEKITESKERGLRPLLRSISNMINQAIIWPINESFEFAFVGLDAVTREEMIDINSKRVRTTMMIDELRAEDDLEPLPDGKGQVILDSTWLQYAQGIDGAKGGGPEGQAETEEEQPEGEPQEEDDNQGDMDYKKILAQYEMDNEDDDEDDETDSERKARTEKSQSRTWIMDL